MKTPTLEEVRERFKDAKIVQDWTGDKRKVTFKKLTQTEDGSVIQEFGEKNWAVLFHDKNGYAKILSYKEPKEKVLELDEEELWLPVHNYFGFYEVSNMGNVRSLSREVKHHINPEFTKKVFGRVLSKTLNSQGYNKVQLSMYGVKKTHLVYHLVSEVFLGHIERSNYVCVDHINEIKTDDRASNLQIISKQENTKKSFDYKLDQFKPGDYWFHSTGELCLIFEVTKLHGGTVKCKHINNTEHFAYHGICVMEREATNQEVEEALIKEAVRRGFKDGIYYKDSTGTQTEQAKGFLEYKNGDLFFKYSNYTVFRYGKWAEIIPTITKQEAEQKLNCKII